MPTSPAAFPSTRRAALLGCGAALAFALPGSPRAAPAAARDQVLRMGGTGSALAAARAIAEAFARSHPGATVAVEPSLGSTAA